MTLKNKWLMVFAAGLLASCASNEEIIEVEKPIIDQTRFDLMKAEQEKIDPIATIRPTLDSNVQIFPLDGFGEAQYASNSNQSQINANPNVEVFSYVDNNPQAPLVPSPDAIIEREEVTHYSADSFDDDFENYDSAADSPNYVSVAIPGEPLLRIYFAHDSAQIRADDVETLSEAVSRFNPNKENYLSVEGHASVESSNPDPVERRIVNMRVSMDRAYNVARALMQSGVPSEKIRIVSWGESKPSEPRDGLNQTASSRRVEIFRVREE